MHRIEFLTYPSGAPATGSRLTGIRIDDTDLRTYAADATRDHWHREREADGDDDSPADRESFVRTQHQGLPLDELADPVRHFLGEPTPQFAGASAHATPVLGCSCGIWACWPLVAVITVAPDTVTWSGFRQPHREEWGDLPMGPYVFDRSSYEAALASPTALDQDPLAGLHEDDDGADGADGEGEGDSETA
jgi:hypothetical protein